VNRRSVEVLTQILVDEILGAPTARSSGPGSSARSLGQAVALRAGRAVFRAVGRASRRPAWA